MAPDSDEVRFARARGIIETMLSVQREIRANPLLPIANANQVHAQLMNHLRFTELQRALMTEINQPEFETLVPPGSPLRRTPVPLLSDTLADVQASASRGNAKGLLRLFSENHARFVALNTAPGVVQSLRQWSIAQLTNPDAEVRTLAWQAVENTVLSQESLRGTPLHQETLRAAASSHPTAANRYWVELQGLNEPTNETLAFVARRLLNQSTRREATEVLQRWARLPGNRYTTAVANAVWDAIGPELSRPSTGIERTRALLATMANLSRDNGGGVHVLETVRIDPANAANIDAVQRRAAILDVLIASATQDEGGLRGQSHQMDVTRSLFNFLADATPAELAKVAEAFRAMPHTHRMVLDAIAARLSALISAERTPHNELVILTLAEALRDLHGGNQPRAERVARRILGTNLIEALGHVSATGGGRATQLLLHFARMGQAGLTERVRETLDNIVGSDIATNGVRDGAAIRTRAMNILEGLGNPGGLDLVVRRFVDDPVADVRAEAHATLTRNRALNVDAVISLIEIAMGRGANARSALGILALWQSNGVLAGLQDTDITRIQTTVDRLATHAQTDGGVEILRNTVRTLNELAGIASNRIDVLKHLLNLIGNSNPRIVEEAQTVLNAHPNLPLTAAAQARAGELLTSAAHRNTVLSLMQNWLGRGLIRRPQPGATDTGLVGQLHGALTGATNLDNAKTILGLISQFRDVLDPNGQIAEQSLESPNEHVREAALYHASGGRLQLSEHSLNHLVDLYLSGTHIIQTRAALRHFAGTETGRSISHRVATLTLVSDQPGETPFTEPQLLRALNLILELRPANSPALTTAEDLVLEHYLAHANPAYRSLAIQILSNVAPANGRAIHWALQRAVSGTLPMEEAQAILHAWLQRPGGRAAIEQAAETVQYTRTLDHMRRMISLADQARANLPALYTAAAQTEDAGLQESGFRGLERISAATGLLEPEAQRLAARHAHANYDARQALRNVTQLHDSVAAILGEEFRDLVERHVTQDSTEGRSLEHEPFLRMLTHLRLSETARERLRNSVDATITFHRNHGRDLAVLAPIVDVVNALSGPRESDPITALITSCITPHL